jgi:hypothetical protein
MSNDKHRRPTTLGVDVSTIQQELQIAGETKRNLRYHRRRRVLRVLLNGFIIFGVIYGYLALGARLWQKMHGH